MNVLIVAIVKSIKLFLCTYFLICTKSVRALSICIAYEKKLFEKSWNIETTDDGDDTNNNTKCFIPALFSLDTHTRIHKECLAKVRLSYLFFGCLLFCVAVAAAIIILVVRACMCHENSNEMEWFLSVRFILCSLKLTEHPKILVAAVISCYCSEQKAYDLANTKYHHGQTTMTTTNNLGKFVDVMDWLWWKLSDEPFHKTK